MQGTTRNLLAITAYCCLAAALVRWPCIPYWNAAPLDPNFPLHALAAMGLAEGDLARLSYLEWPEGAVVRYVGWPPMAIAAALNALLPPIPSMNLAVWAWTALQGIGTWQIGKAWGWDRPGRFAAATGAIFAPQALLALGNGQFENAALMPLLWTAWSCREGRLLHFVPAFTLCLFSSPYQGVCAVAAALLLSERVLRTALAMAPVLGAAGLYYGTVAAGGVHASVAPAAASMAEHASLTGLLLPLNIAEDGGAGLPLAWERIAKAGELASADIYSHRWPWLIPTASSHVGTALLILGAAGLWLRRRATSRTAAWGAVCLLLALGPALSLGSLQLPLPWALAGFVPGLSEMQATCRFLSGLTAALLIGLPAVARTWRTAAAVSVLLAAEGLLASPAHWPLPALEPVPSKFMERAAEDSAAAFWPAPPVMASYKVTMAALVMETPLALFDEQGAGMPEADGSWRRGTGEPVDSTGRTPVKWRTDIEAAGVRTLLQFRDTTGSQAQPVAAGYGECDEFFCIWTLGSN